MPFSARSFKTFASIVEQFEKDNGGGRVDVVLAGVGLVEGAVRSHTITEGQTKNQIVAIEFEDGHTRLVPIECILQLIVRKDQQKHGVGFTADDGSQLT